MSDKSVMSSRQSAELDFAFERNLWTSEDVKWLSGGTILADFLKVRRGELILVPAPKPALPAWKIWKILILGHPNSVKAYRAALSANGCCVGSYADELLEKMSISEAETEARLVQVAVKDLGFKNPATYGEIIARAEKLGLDPCPAEVGPKLRLECAGQPRDEFLTVAMEPILDSSGYARVFYVGRYSCGGRRWLSTLYVGSDGRWSLDDRFVFLSRK